jgi:mRNA-decapping enzyme subunit 2
MQAVVDSYEPELALRLTPDTEAALDDVASRFLLNLPESEATRVDRLFFQLQQAHWFYEDFYVDDEARHIPHLSWEPFTKILFNRCPLLVHISSLHKEFFASFRSYVRRIPTFGLIMLDAALEQVLLVQAYRGNSWGFPKGKANQGESGLDCGLREGFEETGFDARVRTKASDFITQNDGDKQCTLYIATGVPHDFPFGPRTRKEISKCEWHRVLDIPVSAGMPRASRYWSCRPILPSLLKWIARQRSSGAAIPRAPSGRRLAGSSGGGGGGAAAAGSGGPAPVRHAAAPPRGSAGSALVHGSVSGGGSGGGGGGGGGGGSRRYDDAVTFGEESGNTWSVEDMFKANERLIGRKFTYDGNPDAFGSFTSRYVRYSYGAGGVSDDNSGGGDGDGSSGVRGAPGRQGGSRPRRTLLAQFPSLARPPTAAFRSFSFDLGPILASLGGSPPASSA